MQVVERRIVVVEFDADMLPMIASMEETTRYGKRHHEITCNPSKAYETIFYHDCGSGPATDEPYKIYQLFQGGNSPTHSKHYYWGAEGMTFDVRSTTAEQLAELPAAFPESVFLAGVDDDCETVYCQVCEDSYPDELSTVCAHLRWCDTCGEWRGPGMDSQNESCECPIEDAE